MSTRTPDELSQAYGRRYRILSLIGKGGFGQVYRGRLEGPEGFYKDVAIKLLKSKMATDEILERFRDEARILGLIRDRAIVSVDPPTKLGGRWAVVMEYVDGASAERLLKQGPIPPTAALEMVAEICRALDKIYNQPGIDGKPLHLLHRDIKPGNIQITPSGEVKILDFGIARADFADREAVTTNSIGGTMGYIAPERLEGVEGPSGDIYSLGVVLHKLVTKQLPKKRPAWAPGDEVVPTDDPVEKAVQLADMMRCADYEARPDFREVMKRCRSIISELSGPTLMEWSEATVPEVSALDDDDLVGNLITETLSSIPQGPTAADVEAIERHHAAATGADQFSLGSPTTEHQRPMMAAGAAAVLLGFAAFSFIAAVSILMLGSHDEAPSESSTVLAQGTTTTADAPAGDKSSSKTSASPTSTAQREAAEPAAAADDAALDDPAATAADDAAVDPAPTGADSAAAEGADEAAASDDAVADAAPVTAQAAPAPSKPPPEVAVSTLAPTTPPDPSPDVRTYDLTFSSVPMGAEVFIDGMSIGHTPRTKVPIAAGRHTVRLVAGDSVMEQTIQVGRRSASHYMWRIATDDWEPSF